MDLGYSESQRMLRDSVDRFVERDYPYATHRRIAGTPERFDPQVWATMARLGWLGLSLPVAHGGAGGDAVDVGLVAEGLGRGLVLEPFASTVLLCGGLIDRIGTAAQRARWLPPIAAGELRLAFAHAEPATRWERAPQGTRAVRTAGGWRLDGAKQAVADAPGADRLVVTATVEGESGEPRIGAFVVPANAPGVQAMPYETVDGRRAANLRFEAVGLAEDADLTGGADAVSAIGAVLDAAIAAACADAIGCLKVLVGQTVAYAKQRVQFGQPIAVNQALRHRMVDMSVHTEEAAALALRAALLADAPAAERARAASLAKIRVGRAARFVSEGAMQIHGAMGVTDELNVGAYVKRLLAFEMSLGTAADHQRRLVDLRERAGGPRAFALGA